MKRDEEQTPHQSKEPTPKQKLIAIEEIGPLLATITAEELDALPFGAIQVNRNGEIVAFNAYEEERSGMTKARVLGRNFFTEVAPCANVAEFLGPFRRAAARRNVNVRFDFLFSLPGHFRRVTIAMRSAADSTTVWILVSDLAALNGA